jgi:putative membrane protein
MVMSEASVTDEQARAAEITRALSALALVRTAFSSQRSLMAWMRTSVSLYTFGFSIAKFTDYLEQRAQGVEFSGSPRLLGLILIAMGIVAIVLAVFEHSRRIRRMKQLGLPDTSRSYLPTIAALALFVIGSTTLVGIALNWPA